MSSSRIMYIRDDQWNPVGTVVISVDRAHRRAKYGLSVLSTRDSENKVHFDRKEGHRLALKRLVDSPRTVSIPKDATQHDISLSVMNDIRVNPQAPKRASHFAKQWISNVTWLYLSDREDSSHSAPALTPVARQAFDDVLRRLQRLSENTTFPAVD